ncbi:MAG: VacJ family lipoprotein [Desulfobulbus propionicus]|nr:MAG: VacJ family lipoprotein [Desulfobulbus propionicus]
MLLAIAGLLGTVPGYCTDDTDFLSDDFYESETVYTGARDPIEPFNRLMFEFNDISYTWVVDPVARGYSQLLPGDLRGSIGNFFSNLGEPVRAVNCLLQGRVEDAGQVVGRFFLNTVFGVFGFGDAATRVFKVDPVYASLGETLGVWGIGDGFYLVVPFFGASTLRDFTGTVVDGFAMTSCYPWWPSDPEASFAVYSGREVNRVSLHLGEYEALKDISFDPYVAMRNAYFQYREKRRNSGEEDLSEER